MKSFIYLATLTASIAVMIPSYAFDQSSPANSLVVDVNGNVGVGTATPGNDLEVSRAGINAQIQFTDTTASHSWTIGQGINNALVMENPDPSSGVQFRLLKNGNFILKNEAGLNTWTINNVGNMTIPGVLTEGSDINSKEDIRDVDTKTVLDKINKLDIATWKYKSETQSVRHMGPMAQDFYKRFSLGVDDRHIATLDTSGVALAGIQELTKQSLEKDKAHKALYQSLQDKISKLEAVINQLKK